MPTNLCSSRLVDGNRRHPCARRSRARNAGQGRADRIVATGTHAHGSEFLSLARGTEVEFEEVDGS